MGDDVLEYPYPTLCFLATRCLMKTTWQFLWKHKLTLRHDIKINPQREGDIPLMKIFYEAGVRDLDLLAINRCRIYLKIFFLSDIATGNGMHVNTNLVLGQPIETYNDFIWPIQGKPSTREWVIWKTSLQTYVTLRYQHLRYPLEMWLSPPNKHTWFYSPSENRLYKKQVTGWTWFHHIPSRTRRMRFQKGEQGSEPPTDILRATVYQKHSHLLDMLWIPSPALYTQFYYTDIFTGKNRPTSGFRKVVCRSFLGIRQWRHHCRGHTTRNSSGTK